MIFSVATHSVIKRTLDFLNAKRDNFLFASICIMPLFGIIRLVLKKNQLFSSSLTLILLSLFAIFNLALYLFILFDSNFNRRILLFFIRLCNHKTTQNLIIFGLIMEQLFLAFPILFSCVFLGPFSLLYWSSMGHNSLLWTPLHLVLVLSMLYAKIRRSLLNADAFRAAGCALSAKPSENGMSWNDILSGLNGVITQKLGPTAKPQGTSGPTGPTERAGSNGLALGALPQSSPLVGPVFNRIPSAAKVVFPFFPQTNLRHMATRGKAAIEAVNKAVETVPGGMAAVIASAASLFTGAAYTVYRDQANYNQSERQHQETVALKKEELEVRKEELEVRKYEAVTDRMRVEVGAARRTDGSPSDPNSPSDPSLSGSRPPTGAASSVRSEPHGAVHRPVAPNTPVAADTGARGLPAAGAVGAPTARVGEASTTGGDTASAGAVRGTGVSKGAQLESACNQIENPLSPSEPLARSLIAYPLGTEAHPIAGGVVGPEGANSYSVAVRILSKIFDL